MALIKFAAICNIKLAVIQTCFYLATFTPSTLMVQLYCAEGCIEQHILLPRCPMLEMCRLHFDAGAQKSG